MADSKITALTAISTVDPTADPLVIVDVSDTSMAASGTTKKSTINQLLGAGGTATLASATITGDLTVDTSTLYVNSSTDRVSIGTLSALGSAKLSIAGKTQADTAVAGDVIGNFNNTSATGYGFRIGGGSATGGYALSVNNNAGSEFHQISGTGIATWSNVGGVAGTAMTLNSGGLAIGTATNYGKLSVAGSIASFASATIGAVSANSGYVVYSAYAGAGAYISLQPTNSSGTQFEAARIDTNGNLILSSSTVPATLASNYQLTLNATSNTNLRFSYRGSDGVTRVANITLA